jgi:hypothetical protein
MGNVAITEQSSSPPRQPASNRAFRYRLRAIAALFSLVGLTLGVIGLIDLTASEQTGPKVLGFILMIVGSILLWTGRTAVTRQAPSLSLSLVLLACILILLVGLFFLLSVTPSFLISLDLRPLVVSTLTVIVMGLTLSILVFALRVAKHTVGLQAVLRMGSLLPLSGNLQKPLNNRTLRV